MKWLLAGKFANAMRSNPREVALAQDFVCLSNRLFAFCQSLQLVHVKDHLWSLVFVEEAAQDFVCPSGISPKPSGTCQGPPLVLVNYALCLVGQREGAKVAQALATKHDA